MHHFALIDNQNGYFSIECLFVVQRAKFGHHPDFLPQNEEKGRRDGFSTKFWVLVDDNLEQVDAENKISEYIDKYEKLISEIEDDDSRWNEFPFKDKPVVFSK